MGKRIKRALSLFLAAVLTITSVELNDVFTVSAFAEDVPADDAAELLICDWIQSQDNIFMFGKNGDDNYAWFTESANFIIKKIPCFALAYKHTEEGKTVYENPDISKLHVYFGEDEVDLSVIANNIEYTFGTSDVNTPDEAINGKYDILYVDVANVGEYSFVYDPDGSKESGDEVELKVDSSLPDIGFYTGFGLQADKLLENYEFDTSKTNFVYILTKSGFDKNYSIRVNNNGEYINKNDDKFNDYIELVTGVDECIILKESIIGKNLEIVILSEDGEVDWIAQNLIITKAPQSRIYSEGWIIEENGKYSLGYISESNKANFKSTSWTEDYLNNSLYIFRNYDPDTNESTPVDILDTSVVDITMPEGASGFTEVGSLEFEEKTYKVYSLKADKLGEYKVTYKADNTSVAINSKFASIRFFSENEENIDNYLTEYEYNKYERFNWIYIFTDEDIDSSKINYSLKERDNLGFWKDEISNDLGSVFTVIDNGILFKKAFNGSLIARYSDENSSYERWIDLREKEYSSLQISMDIDWSEENGKITVNGFRDYVCFEDYIKQPIYGTSLVVFAYYNPQNGTYTPVELNDISVNKPANAPEFVDTNVKIEKDGQKYSVYSIDRSVVGKYEFTYEGTTAVFENTLPGIAAYTGEEATFENIISIAKYNKNKEVNQFYINILDENVNASDLTFVIRDYFNNTSYEGDELKNHIGIEEVNEKQIKVTFDKSNLDTCLEIRRTIINGNNEEESMVWWNVYIKEADYPQDLYICDWIDEHWENGVPTYSFGEYNVGENTYFAWFNNEAEVTVKYSRNFVLAYKSTDKDGKVSYKDVKTSLLHCYHNDKEVDLELECLATDIEYTFGSEDDNAPALELNGKYDVLSASFDDLGEYRILYDPDNSISEHEDNPNIPSMSGDEVYVTINSTLPRQGFFTSETKSLDTMITDWENYVYVDTVYALFENEEDLNSRTIYINDQPYDSSKFSVIETEGIYGYKVELDDPGNNSYNVSVVDKELNDDGSTNTYFGFCVVRESQLLWADWLDYNVETGKFSFHRSEDGSEYARFYPVSEQVELGWEKEFALLNIDNSNGTTYESVTGISVKYNDTEDVEVEWRDYTDYEFGNQENGTYWIYYINFNKLGKYTLTYTNSNNVTTSVDIQCVLPEAGFYTSSEKSIENLILDQYSYVENETVYFIYKNDGLLAYDICTEEYANDLFSFNSIRDNVFTFTLKKMPEKSTKDGFEILVKLEYEDGSRRETAIYFKYRENIAAGKVAFGNIYDDGDCAILEKARTSLELKYGVDYCNLFWFGISKGDGTFIPVDILDSANKLTIYYQENASSKKTVANYNEEYGKTPVRVNMEYTHDDFSHYSFYFDETGIYTVELTVNGIKSSVKVTVDESYFESPFIGTIISEEDYNNGQFDLRNAEAKLRTGETMQEVIDKLTADIKSGAKNTGYLYITLNSSYYYFVNKATYVTQTISTENYGIADINGILIDMQCARDSYNIESYRFNHIVVDATTSVSIQHCVNFGLLEKNFSDGEIIIDNARFYRNGDEGIFQDFNGIETKYPYDDIKDTDTVFVNQKFSFNAAAFFAASGYDEKLIDIIHDKLTDIEKEKLEKSGHNISINAKCTNDGSNLPDKVASILQNELNNEDYILWNVDTFVLDLSYSIGSDEKVIKSFDDYETITIAARTSYDGKTEDAVLYNYCDGKLEKLEIIDIRIPGYGESYIKAKVKNLGRFVLVYNTKKLKVEDFSRDDTSIGDTYDYGVDYRTDLINIDYQGWGLRYQPEIEGILEYVLFDENSKPVQRDKYGYYPAGSYKVHLINKQFDFDYEVPNYTITITPAFCYYLYFADGNVRNGSFKATDAPIDVIEKAYYGNGYREEGYTLKGWFTESGEQVTEIDPSNPKFQKVVVLYEKVVPKTYTLKYTEYDDDYNEINSFTQTLTFGETETIKAPSQAMNNAHKGERFVGWKCALTNFRLISPGEKVKLVYFEGVMNIFSTSDERFGKVEAVLTPVYESNEYTVTYKFDSETVLATGKYKYGKGLTLLKSIPATAPVTSVEGYTFAGWYTEEIGGTKLTSIGKKTYGDVVVYAHWTPKTYTVSFNRNGGTSGSMKDVKYTYDTYGVLPANKFSYPGYYFAGWSTSKDSTEIQYPDSFSVKNLVSSGKITLYAVWISICYRLDYDYMTDDNVEGPVDLEFEYDKKNGVALAGKDSITREGYIFDGWYKDSKYKTKITSTKGLSKDTIVYAKWKADNYTVYLHSDVSDYIAEPKTISNVKYAKGTALPNNTFTCTDSDGVKYAFVGWSTVPGATEATYKNKGKIPAYVEGLKITEEGKLVLDLYAVWKAEYRINYVLNGGELISLYVTDSYMYGEGINGTDRSLNIPARDGYTFAGWYNNAKFQGKAITTISATSASDITLYAKWNALKYKVTYNSNAPYGTTVSGKTNIQKNVVYGKSTALTKNGFKIKGYKFVGWSTNSEATEADYTDKQKVTGFGSYSSEITLYAVWELEEYTVTYVINGKKVETFTYTVNDDYYLYAYARPGYTFKGWYTDKSCKKKASNFKAGTTGNKTFYGKETMNK